MPPKKGKKGKKNGDENEVNTLGRFGKTLKMGLVGLPNVGKSTTFNLLSDLDVPAENYAFCTKEPHDARVPVPDKRFTKLCEIFKPKSKVPAFLNVWDIAGLIRGAHEGNGLGNAFLSNIQAVDGIFHVVRAFDDADITHYDGDVDPVRDLETISFELSMKDRMAIKNRIPDLTKLINRNADKLAIEEKEVLEKALEILEAGRWIKDCEWTSKEIMWLNTNLFMTAKPVIYLVNISKKDMIKQKNKYLPLIKEWIEKNCPGKMLPYSAAYEKAIISGEITNPKPKSMINKIITTGYKNLDLAHFFTSGADEVKCWTIKKGQKAPAAAGKIHSDIEDGFICAEVMSYDDFIEFGSEGACKANGKYRQQGKEYLVLDGDIVFFKFNPPKKKK